MTNTMQDRRRHKRFKLAPDIIEPLQIKLPTHPDRVPGIVVDLSAGGVALITYEEIPLGTQIDLSFKLVGIKVEHAKAKVTRVKEHGVTYLIVLTFDKLHKEIEHQIETVAMDYEDCEIKLQRGDKNICVKKCTYYPCCNKSIKK